MLSKLEPPVLEGDTSNLKILISDLTLYLLSIRSLKPSPADPSRSKARP